jgi:hypothetical protein
MMDEVMTASGQPIRPGEGVSQTESQFQGGQAKGQSKRRRAPWLAESEREGGGVYDPSLRSC